MICTPSVSVDPRGVTPLSEPVHHVPTETLVAYAAGVEGAAVEVLVASHLTLCATCRAVVEGAEEVGGALLLSSPPAPLGATAWPRLLARLDEEEAHSAPLAPCAVLPAPIRARTGSWATIRWRPVGAGLRIAPIDVAGDPNRVFLLELPAGFRVPTHRHRGTERVLLLGGGFSDAGVSFGRGDVSWHDASGHAVVVDDDAPCVALFVNDGPFVVGGALGTKLLDRWLRRAS